ncbi:MULTISPECIES: cation:proton antiporter [Limosilactobacillus]|uniref:Transporter, CPA2 family n=1 Tax=Limosilactobacillus panis DSM 6035 TaxID=1423782 RepID=A0A0R1XDW3_9LACO|nr:sodium:proton antiporter [Limosilactobacillus panis]KRM25283.1 transporter, CPA2 family [Limosilactobacillus panis DSM 6035]
MELLLGIILLLATVVVANIIHLIFPRIPLSIYQILAGVLLASLPTAATNFTMHPELFMMVVIAPLMFNDGQNQSFRYLSKNYKSIFSISVLLALVTVLVAGSILHLAMPMVFPFALAFILAAIITPTDAVAVKSITSNMTVPENVNGALEYESLFNDASGIVLLELSLSAYRSGEFSIGYGLWFFIYVFFGGIIFGAIFGYLLITLRQRLMRRHVDIGSIVIPINVMTPIVIYWSAEEIHFSGILAVVSAGIVHSILYDRLQLTSTKVQMATTTIWTIVSDSLNGIVFVLLGVMLPQVIQRTAPRNLLNLALIGLALYLIMTVMRYLWVRLRLVNIDSEKVHIKRDSLLMSIGGMHGTITLSLAFSLPVIINHHEFAFRNSIILIAAFVILISILVGAIVYPIMLPSKARDYSQEEFQRYLTATVHYAINDLHGDNNHPRERAMVRDQLSTQAHQFHNFDNNLFKQLMNRTHQVELATIDRLTDEGKITEQEAQAYSRFVTRSVLRGGQHGLLEFCKVMIHRLKWRLNRWHYLRKHGQKLDAKQKELIDSKRAAFNKIQLLVYRNVERYLHSVSNPNNLNEIAMVQRVYLKRKEFFNRDRTVDNDVVTSLFIEAFQLEHGYVQQKLAAGELSQELANALNEQISTDELVYAQSLD